MTKSDIRKMKKKWTCIKNDIFAEYYINQYEGDIFDKKISTYQHINIILYRYPK